MVNLVASEGREFASVWVPSDSLLYSHGSGEEAFFWVMGPEFVFRLDRIRMERACECGGLHWKVFLGKRSFNGAGSEVIDLVVSEEATVGDASVLLAGVAVMIAFFESADPAMLALGCAIGEPVALGAAWAGQSAVAFASLVRDEMVRAEAERFVSMALDEV